MKARDANRIHQDINNRVGVTRTTLQTELRRVYKEILSIVVTRYSPSVTVYIYNDIDRADIKAIMDKDGYRTREKEEEKRLTISW